MQLNLSEYQYMCLMSQIRPAFEDAMFYANWNWWFFVAVLAPFCVLAFAYVLRRNMIYFVPIAIASFVLAYFCGVRELGQLCENAAQTEEEWEIVCQDTGRVFAPLFIGVPLSFFWTGIAFAGYFILELERKAREMRLVAEATVECENCGRAVALSSTICPRCMNKLQSCESPSSLAQSNATVKVGPVNPYTPPSSK